MSLALPAVLPALTSLLSPSEPTVVEVIGPRVPGVKLLAVIYSGSADDPAGKEGLAFLTAQLMRREAADRAGALAGNLRLSVGKDLIVFDAEASREDAGRLIEVFETILLKPTADSAGMEAQRAEQVKAIEAALHDPGTLAREAFDAFVFRGHPYAHAPAGRLSSVERITRDDVAAFQAAHLRKGNLAIGLAGDVTEALAARIKQDLAALPDGEPAREARPISWLPRPRVLVVEEPAATPAVIRIGHALDVTRAHPDYFALKLAEVGLGADPESADITIEVADEAPAIGEPERPPLHRRQQAFVLSASSPPSDAASTVRLALNRINGMTRSGLDDSRLDQLRRSAASRSLFEQGDPVAELAARMDELLWRTPGFSERYLAGLSTVTTESFRGAVTRELHPDRLAVVAVVPAAKEFIDRLLAATSGGSLTRDDFEVATADSLFR